MEGVYAGVALGDWAMKGYIYRCAPISADQLRKLIEQQVGLPCWHFSGASLWRQPTLSAIQKLGHKFDVDVNDDFGHAFSNKAEVRWKRIDLDTYDVLILSEQNLSIEGAYSLAGDWEVREHQQRRLIQSGKRERIVYYTYHAPSGIAQFTRYIEVVP
ncbi:hypothetical protein [Chloroflexus sp.]|uniref:hypothetical protein n=1 Tax=Chloroflexus sp. TaxID=1904827 RepID=UPI002ACECD90|nr:hypothetical protein [Chloroflexus sp.]